MVNHSWACSLEDPHSQAQLPWRCRTSFAGPAVAQGASSDQRDLLVARLGSGATAGKGPRLGWDYSFSATTLEMALALAGAFRKPPFHAPIPFRLGHRSAGLGPKRALRLAGQWG